MTDAPLQQKRLIAAAIDIAVLFAFATVQLVFLSVAGCAISKWGMIAGYALRIVAILIGLLLLGYVLGRDLLGGGRSLGKKLMEIHVVRTDGGAIGMMDSAKRNVLFAAPGVLSLVVATINLIPCAVCFTWPLYILSWGASLGVLIWTIIDIVQQPDGTHFGDRTAGTRVTW
jgi:uncharacterized RDD family membrane protein YckC